MGTKQIISLFLILLISLAGVGCGQQNNAADSDFLQEKNSETNQNQSENQPLVFGSIDPETNEIKVNSNPADQVKTETAENNLTGSDAAEGMDQNENRVDGQPDNDLKKATITANGDHLMHNILYMSAYDPATDSYDFKEHYEESRTLTEKADLAIGNFEGTMRPDYELSGYPTFNSPPEVAEALKYAGYDLMTVANNHIADSNGPGILTTVGYLNEQGIDVFGVNLPDKDFIVVKDVNGIKFAFLAYSYAFNGMDATLTEEEQEMLSWIDPVKIEQDIKRAETMADVVVVFPHMGIEYELQPTEEQVTLYRNMVDWGADLVIGNHPHVIQPIEHYHDKFILYSMGNFISNQRLESGLDIWTERGVILEFNFEKKGDEPAELVSYKLHPTWVDRYENGLYSPEGQPLYEYRVLLAENHLDNERISTAYYEVLAHMEGDDSGSEGW